MNNVIKLTNQKQANEYASIVGKKRRFPKVWNNPENCNFETGDVVFVIEKKMTKTLNELHFAIIVVRDNKISLLGVWEDEFVATINTLPYGVVTDENIKSALEKGFDVKSVLTTNQDDDDNALNNATIKVKNALDIISNQEQPINWLYEIMLQDFKIKTGIDPTTILERFASYINNDIDYSNVDTYADLLMLLFAKPNNKKEIVEILNKYNHAEDELGISEMFIMAEVVDL